MRLITDFDRGARNHKVWLIPLLVVALLALVLSKWISGCVARREADADAAYRPVDLTVPLAPPDPGRALVDEAAQLLQNKDMAGAREKCFAALDGSSNAAARAAAEEMLGRIHIELVTTPVQMPEKAEHTVARGETLGGVAKKYGTTPELIRKSNNLSSDVVRAATRLRVLNGRFEVFVSKTRNDLEVRMNGKFFKRYRVGTGQYGTTPTGTFHVVEKMNNPIWFRPGGKAVPFGTTNNVLGTRWLSLDIPSYGIHGTWEPDTIGKQSSAGCIRLVNADVEELSLLVPTGVPVTISE